MACMSDRGKQDAGTVLLVPLPGACEAAPVSAALYLKANLLHASTVLCTN